MAVLWVLVYADVENVFVAWPADSEEEKKTRAKPGAGTGIVHWLVEVLQVIVVILRVPRKRPSTVS